MSENVVVLPGIMPEICKPPVNDEAVEILEEMLADFKAGRLHSFVAVGYHDGLDVLKYSAPTYGDMVQVSGLVAAALTHLSGIIALAAFD